MRDGKGHIYRFRSDYGIEMRNEKEDIDRLLSDYGNEISIPLHLYRDYLRWSFMYSEVVS